MADILVPDDKCFFLLLRQLDFDDKQARTLVQDLQTMAANSTVKFESRLAVLVAEQKPQLDDSNSKLDTQRSKFAAQDSRQRCPYRCESMNRLADRPRSREIRRRSSPGLEQVQ